MKNYLVNAFGNSKISVSFNGYPVNPRQVVVMGFDSPKGIYTDPVDIDYDNIPACIKEAEKLSDNDHYGVLIVTVNRTRSQFSGFGMVFVADKTGYQAYSLGGAETTYVKPEFLQNLIDEVLPPQNNA